MDGNKITYSRQMSAYIKLEPIGNLVRMKGMIFMRKISDVTAYEWIRFNMWIDKMKITHKLIYESILQDFLSSGKTIDQFIKNPI